MVKCFRFRVTTGMSGAAQICMPHHTPRGFAWPCILIGPTVASGKLVGFWGGGVEEGDSAAWGRVVPGSNVSRVVGDLCRGVDAVFGVEGLMWV